MNKGKPNATHQNLLFLWNNLDGRLVNPSLATPSTTNLRFHPITIYPHGSAFSLPRILPKHFPPPNNISSNSPSQTCELTTVISNFLQIKKKKLSFRSYGNQQKNYLSGR